MAIRRPNIFLSALPSGSRRRALVRRSLCVAALLAPVGVVDNYRDGKETWVMTSKIPWRDHTGQIIGTSGIARDVTALKEAEVGLASEHSLKALLDSSPDKIYFNDSQSRFIRCSKAQTELFQAASTDDLIGKTDFDFFTPDHAQLEFEDEQAIMRTGKPLIAKVEKETWRDGRVRWVTSKIPLSDNANAIIGAVGISKDITALREAGENLAQAHKQLLEASGQAGMAEVATSVLHNVGNVLNTVNVSAPIAADRVRNSNAAFVSKVGALLQGHPNDLASCLENDPRGSKIPPYLTALGEELGEQRSVTEELGHLRKNVEPIKEIVSRQQNFAKVSGVVEPIGESDGPGHGAIFTLELPREAVQIST